MSMVNWSKQNHFAATTLLWVLWSKEIAAQEKKWIFILAVYVAHDCYSNFFGFCYSCWHTFYSYCRGEKLLIFRHQLFQPLQDFSLFQLTSTESLFNTVSRIAAHGTWQSKEYYLLMSPEQSILYHHHLFPPPSLSSKRINQTNHHLLKDFPSLLLTLSNVYLQLCGSEHFSLYGR